MDSEERIIQETLDKNTSELEAQSNIDDIDLDRSSPKPTHVTSLTTNQQIWD
jgi:hypothetical protein